MGQKDGRPRRPRFTGVLGRVLPSGSSKDQDWRRERLAVYQMELRALKEDLEEGGAGTRYTNYAEDLLVRAEETLERRDIESFWANVSAAKQWELKGIAEIKPSGERSGRGLQSGVSHLELRAQRMLSEATDALNEERARRIQELLADGEGYAGDSRVLDVLSASRLLYNGYVAEYRERRRYRVVKRQLSYFAAIGLVTVSVILALWSPEFELDEPISRLSQVLYYETEFLIVVPLFGVLGATTSSLLSLSRGLSRTQPPERTGTLGLTIARITVGGASALVIYTFLIAGLVNVVIVTPGTVFAFSFISGFTERLLVRAVEAVTGTTTD